MSQNRDYADIRSLDAAKKQLREKDQALSSLRAELDQCQEEMSNLEKDPVAHHVGVIAKTRMDSTCIPTLRPGTGRVVTDKVFHEMYLDRELDGILRHPLLDRLRSIKQLSFTYQEQPTALHSRLSHSLGVARNVEFALQSIFDRDRLYTIESKEKRTGKVSRLGLNEEAKRKMMKIAKATALLHDLGHSPFGHSLDRFITAQLYKKQIYLSEKPDKYYSCKYIKSVLAEALVSYGLDPLAMAKAINVNEHYVPPRIHRNWAKYLPLVTAILDSDLDADRIDYLPRDSDSTGLPYGAINSAALLSSMLPTFDKKTGVYGIAYDENVVGYIGHAVSGRIRMYEECYETQAKIASETMLTNALRYFLERYPALNVEDLLVLTDDELLATILTNAPLGSPERSLVELLLKQQCFVRIIEPIRLRREHRDYDSIECDRYLDAVTLDESPLLQHQIPLDWQEHLTLKLPNNYKWMVEVYATPYDRFEVKEQQIRVITESRGSFTYTTLAESEKEKLTVQMLQERNKMNPRVEVFGHDKLPIQYIEEVRKACGTIFRKKQEDEVK